MTISLLFLPAQSVTSSKLLNLSVLGFLSHEMEYSQLAPQGRCAD